MTKMNPETRENTSKAYQIVWSMLAPGLVGARNVSDQHKCAACAVVKDHWQQYGEMPMPADVREVVDHWVGRMDELFPA